MGIEATLLRKKHSDLASKNGAIMQHNGYALHHLAMAWWDGNNNIISADFMSTLCCLL
jgi:hypothetical protein